MSHQGKTDHSFIFEDPLMCADATQCGKTAKSHQGSASSEAAVVHQKKKEMEQHLATTLRRLSAEERNAVLEEINGVVDIDFENSNEEPVVLDRKLIEMDQHLQTIKIGSVYEKAESIDLDYVQDQDFRLKFLRSQRYDPIKAAKQVIDFFESKHWLFGEEKLCKDITLDDLSKNERRFLRKGCCQVLAKDTGGRAIITYLRGLDRDSDTMTELRCKYYMLMALVESKETQKKGVVALWYVVGDYYKDKKGGRGWDEITRLAPTLPVYWAALHFCCDDIVQYALIQAVVLAFPKDHAARFRCHKGTHLECKYALRTYGIPASALPIPETDGNKPPLLYQHTVWYHARERQEDQERLAASSLAQKQHHRAMECRSAATVHIIPDDNEKPLPDDGIMKDFRDSFTEEDNATQLQGAHVNQEGTIGGARRATNIAITPRRPDVLFGAKHTYHPGNLQLWQMISRQVETFESIDHRAEKIKFVGMLVQHMKASGVRFLAEDRKTNRWIEINDKIVRNKVSKAFHNKSK